MQLFRPHHGGKGEGYPVERAGGAFGLTFVGLKLFPAVLTALAIICGGAEYVRVASFHLRADGFSDIAEREQLGFFGNARVEYNLQQKIAQFVFQRRHIAALDRVGNLVGFLDRVRRDRGKALREIPFAAALRIAQQRHNRQKTVKRGSDGFGHLRMIIYIMLNDG